MLQMAQSYKHYGVVEDVEFNLAGHSLRSNFVITSDNMGIEGFLLG